MNLKLRGGDTLAALDLGTTNCRLLIARQTRGRLRVVDSFSRIVRLGEGLQASGRLSEPAMTRTLEALAICAEKLRHRQVDRARYVTTEACRRAANCGDFLDRVRHHTGLSLELIPMEEEARLALAGCAPLLDPTRRMAVVFDIGGGSTEVLWVGVSATERGIETEIRDVISLPFGVVSLTERFADRPPTPPTFAEMIGVVREGLEPFDARWHIRQAIDAGGVQMLGSSGTVTTLAGIKLGLPRYERQHVDGAALDFGEVRDISRRIVRMTPVQRAQEPCIGAGRADLMVAGCAILEGICRTWKVGRLRVADRGVREGILAGLMQEEDAGFPAPALPAARGGGAVSMEMGRNERI